LDFSAITETLFIGTTPVPDDYPILAKNGVQLVINMRLERRPYPDPFNTGMQFLWLPSIDSPLLPIPIQLLHKGVEQALKVLQSGGKVYTHCAAGIHRGVVMGACILIACGRTAKESMELIKKRRSNSDPRVWYIRNRILRFEKSWRAHTRS
jgi:protein-tyrosine phosphatase